MVYTNLNRIQFGNGDVSVMVSMAGTRKEPQAMLVFQNREPAKIGRIDEDADLSRTKLGVYNPNKDIAMLFSKPESIDCVISALLAVKKATFGENNLFHTQIGVGNRLDGGRRRVKKYLWSFFRTAPAGQVRL